MNETPIWKMSLSGFLDATSSESPTPGGGSVSAVCGALGLGLVIMALEITIRGTPSSQETESLLNEARKLLEEVKTRADEDVAVFNAYMSALRLPKSTDEEKDNRKRALKAATIRATEVPLQTARNLHSSLLLASRAVEFSKVHVLSDVAAGADLLLGAILASLRNVDINVASLKDAALAEEFTNNRRDLDSATREAHAKIEICVKQRFATV